MRRSGRRFFSSLAGAGLYLTAQALGQYLGALGIPHSWVSFLGVRGSLGVQVGEALILALPVLLVSLTWAWLTVRPWGGARHPHTAWCVGGCVIAAVGSLLAGVVSFSLNPPGYEVPVSYMLLRYSQAPLWGVQNSLAAFAGLTLAVLAVNRYMRRHSSRTRSPIYRPGRALGPVPTSSGKPR
ncbi:hypothetical protein J7U46_20150 [Pelomonas sp. V22]|uniref:hypothetical protein n=1 Tax=Pelomonas sp. V22 TaxID=2822139 RepID=UPI0024A7F0AE|nr:hypothetical protein [Pelomonas sp. V22]MDI4635387.1 hypothetical protein [Pelomonas sp. V22]